MLYYKLKLNFPLSMPWMPTWGSRGTAPLILKFGAIWRHVVNFTSQLFHTRERTLAPTEDETG